MLFPKKVKHRKWQTNRISEERRQRPDTRGITVAYGEYGLMATTGSRVKSNQIEAARKAHRMAINNTRRGVRSGRKTTELSC